MAASTKEQASEILERAVQINMADSCNGRNEAERIERSNIGYFAGYYDSSTRETVEELFDCQRPVFGSISENGPPSMEDAFRAGFELGRSIRDGKNGKG